MTSDPPPDGPELDLPSTSLARTLGSRPHQGGATRSPPFRPTGVHHDAGVLHSHRTEARGRIDHLMDPFARIVVGYHGCTEGFARELLLGTLPIREWRPSANVWDWLGRGIYF